MDREAFVRRYYELFNERRFSDAAALIAPDAQLHHVPLRQRLTGPAGYHAFATTWTQAFPDGRLTIEGITIKGDVAVVRLLGRGTHLGTFDLGTLGTFPPTGGAAELTFVEELTIRDGLVHGARLTFDFDKLIAQLIRRR